MAKACAYSCRQCLFINGFGEFSSWKSIAPHAIWTLARRHQQSFVAQWRYMLSVYSPIGHLLMTKDTNQPTTEPVSWIKQPTLLMPSI